MTEIGHLNERLQDFLDARLSPDEAAQIESHLSKCELCQLELRALQKAKQAAAGAAEIAVPSDLRNKIMDSLNREDDRRKK